MYTLTTLNSDAVGYLNLNEFFFFYIFLKRKNEMEKRLVAIELSWDNKYKITDKKGKTK